MRFLAQSQAVPTDTLDNESTYNIEPSTIPRPVKMAYGNNLVATHIFKDKLHQKDPQPHYYDVAKEIN